MPIWYRKVSLLIALSALKALAALIGIVFNSIVPGWFMAVILEVSFSNSFYKLIFLTGALYFNCSWVSDLCKVSYDLHFAHAL